jgi:alcohol dehydrogenase (cytochrome c)
MAWYFSTAPHDTHDWDSTETPAIADLPFGGRMRKLIMTVTRNGYFFVLDRTTGKQLLTSKVGLVNNWAAGLDDKGQPQRNPNKDAQIAGALVNGDVTNYPPPTFSPDTGLFYVHEQNTMRISYLMEPDPRGSMGLGGTSGGANLSWGTHVIAIDYKTGKIVWRKELTAEARVCCQPPAASCSRRTARTRRPGTPLLEKGSGIRRSAAVGAA